MNIYKSMYKDIQAVTLENDCLKAQFTPECGGKIVSLVHKKTSREFLVQARNPNYKVLEYDGNYVEAECSGFDDMFPTIDRMFYPDYPWKGVEIPDHGEVCGLKWDYEIRKDCLYMGVNGVRFPYRLEKCISFGSDNLLNINYRAVNLSGYDMDFLWAAHPMINSEEGGEILVPYNDPQEVTCTFSSDEKLGRYGERLFWPKTVCSDGSKRMLSLIDNRNDNKITYKYYFRDRIPVGWCAYRYKSDNTMLKLSFPEDKVPYLGIWINEGVFKGYNNLALEMCTGSFDRPDIAKMHNQNSILRAKGEYFWFLNFEVK